MATDGFLLVQDIKRPGNLYSNTRTYDVAIFSSESGLADWHVIRCTAAPGSDFDDAPEGSTYIDMTNYKEYIKTAASTWTVKGAQS